MGDGYSNNDWIISAPVYKPTNLSITRGNGNMELKWGIPQWMVNGVDPDMTFQDVWWSFNASQDMSTKYKEVRGGGGHVIADKLWIRDLGTSPRSHTQDFDRSRYYPHEARKLNSVTGWVVVNDTEGHDALNSTAQSKVTYTFKKPFPPTVGTDLYGDPPTLDKEERKVSFHWEYRDDDEYLQDGYDHERCQSYWTISRKDNTRPEYRTEVALVDCITTDNSGTAESDALEDINSLSYNQWVDIHFRIRAEGFAGDSPTQHVLYTIAWPPKASIESVKYDKDHGFVSVWISTNANAYHPVDTVELQRLADTNIWTVAAAKEVPDSSWETVAESTDELCEGLVDTDVARAKPSTGKYTWYRVKTTRCYYTIYSEPMRAKALEQKSVVENDKIEIHSVTPQLDGTSLKVVLAWNWAGQDSNGTEVTWSQHEDAWQSTTEPNVYDLDDSRMDAQSQVQGKDASATLVIRDLEEGTPYYIRARRYLDGPDSRTYSAIQVTAPAETYPVSPSTEPLAAHLTAPQYVKRGEGATLTWTYDSDADQTSWTLYKVWDEASGSSTVERREVVGAGDDQTGSCTVPTSKLGTGDSASFVVSISTGSGWAESERATVTIADPPAIDADAATLEAQPMSFTCVAWQTNLDVIAKVISNGTSSGTPDGEMVQAEGDVIWSDRLSPSWTRESNYFVSEQTLPTGLPFLDGTRYTLVVSAVDTTTGFGSNTVSVPFSVNWGHKASMPDADITPDVANRTVRLHPIAPQGAAQTDVYDLYRVSNDSCDLVAQGQDFGVDAIDRFAPYSRNMGLTYRLATRTADGSMEWADFTYDMPVGVMRFDWGDGKFVELPYNISLQDSYEKNYESHQHMDGSVSGHWNPGFQKTGSYSTDIIKLQDIEQAKLVREMATYPGPVFVRTPDGGAFEANVTLGVDTTYNSGAVGISLNVQAHSLSDSFRLRPDDFEAVE